MKQKHISPIKRQAAYAALAASALLALAQILAAGPRGSANYSLTTDTTDSGGQRAVSTSYTNDGSAGLIAGVSTIAVPAATAKAGYLGQLYEVTGLALTSEEPELDEGGTLQLAAWEEVDDATFLAVLPADVLWDFAAPLTGNANPGLATAAAVYEDTATTVHGSLGTLTGLLELTVRNVLSDNFGLYAGDGLDDSWQYDNFGLNNLNAGPLKDPDGDGQNNQFEFTAGLVPTDPASCFLLRIEPVTGEPTRKNLIFSPRWTDRTYDILTSTTLATDSWSALSGTEVSDNGDERTVTDPNASESKKFYRVQVNKP